MTDSEVCIDTELLEAGADGIRECLSEMQRFWSECSASDHRKRKEWFEILRDLKKCPLRFKINEIRREISSMWDKCFMSEEEKGRFTDYYSDVFTDDLLTKHKNELERLNAFYIQHKELIDLIGKYDEMWKSVLSIQEQSQNPERLFKNRGAQLLKEEHDRKLVAKIPHMQSVILKALKKKQSEGTIFLIKGEHFSDIIERHNLLKEEKKTVKRTPMACLSAAGPSSKKFRSASHVGLSNADTVRSHRKAVRQLEMK